MILFADGLDGYSSDSDIDGDLTRSTTNFNVLTVNSSLGRAGGGCLIFAGGFNGVGYVTFTLPTALDEVWVALADQDNLTTVEHGLVQFVNASLQPLVTIIRNASGFVEVYKGSEAGTLIATSTGILGATYKHFACKVKFHASTGTVQVRLGGASTLEIDLTGQDTAGAAGNCAFVRVGNPYSAGQWRCDDVVIGDVNGGIDDTCPFDLRVTNLYPTADDSVQFTPSAGGSNYLMVDEASNDHDSTYVESSTVGHKDRYSYSLPSSGVAIHALVMAPSAKGGGSLRNVIVGSSATEIDNGADIVTNASQYEARSSVFSVDPDTSAPWALGLTVKAGYKVAA